MGVGQSDYNYPSTRLLDKLAKRINTFVICNAIPKCSTQTRSACIDVCRLGIAMQEQTENI